MNDQSEQRKASECLADQPLANRPTSGQLRRQLLRAVGTGGALVGVGLPFAAHASGRPYCVRSSQNYHPTASAVGSLIGSVAGTDPPTAGHNCSHYRTSSNWPTTCTNGRGRTLSYSNCANTAATTKLRFWHVFELSDPGTASPKYRYCADILASFSTSDEAHWLTAVFNANKRVPFSYAPTQVLDLYRDLNPLAGGLSQSGLSASALILFRDYLSAMP